ncbi:SepM family pheromone-processing serine protease [Halalkalibacter akibai]|uniref:endopeptidase La n=1 Tax=Halalkalibacter akibai (strain ATCC 43226 / DSM 21942 / CIP 109018 / JCM 9157 / 1139) TaxID=1236973 RepID=W4QQA7_HALA3|nr:SepM family pheromone-processing serine protease [Halalkalibacter akibai]GAE33838.1 Lon-like protease with PDZ domain [Halalkalibacter akibai JCM 9157]
MTSRIKKRWIFLVIAFLFLHFYQLPYYYSQPGGAKVLDEVISVEGGSDEENGTFMLTTVSMGKANLFFYAWAHLSPYRILYPEEQIRYQGETDEDYQHRQLMAMSGSQEVASIVAYEKAGRSIQYDYKGVLVTSIIEGMPAHELLKVGDHILAVDGVEVLTANQLIEFLQGKSEEDTVELSVLRENNLEQVEIGFSAFPEEMNVEEGRVGIGISAPITDREVTFDPPVNIDTSQIGGPSAGLMFSLEMYNQLTESDITKGYDIAGTGTINEEGIVGRIGGASQKVVAADKAGADYFFAPNEGGIEGSNYQEALEAAEDIGTKMKVIPIDHFDDAIAFLESLERKN